MPAKLEPDLGDIPDDLIINIKQMPVSFLLLSKCIMDKKIEKLVPTANSADYHQVTGTFFMTFSGIFLPIQTIYHGKTNHCYAKFSFPGRFNITHSVSNWSNGEKVIELIEKVFYLTFKKGELGLRSTEEWLLIADVFKEQWTNKVTNKVKQLIEKKSWEEGTSSSQHFFELIFSPIFSHLFT